VVTVTIPFGTSNSAGCSGFETPLAGQLQQVQLRFELEVLSISGCLKRSEEYSDAKIIIAIAPVPFTQLTTNQSVMPTLPHQYHVVAS
jgi:hypothetical protein